MTGDTTVDIDDGITDVTQYSEETLFKVQAAITGQGIWGQKALDIIGAIQNAGILFRERVPEPDDSAADLPHPGITDEFWDEIPEKDRESFSTFLVNQANRDMRTTTEKEADDNAADARQSLNFVGYGDPEDDAEPKSHNITASGGWCAPSDSYFFPDVTVKRGGISFTSPKPLLPMSKKELRKALEFQRTLNQKRQRKIDRQRRKIRRLVNVIERMA